MDESSKKILEMVRELWHIALSDWIQNSLFSWQWWLGLLITIVPWVFWIYFRNKKSTNRMLYVAFFAIVFAFVVDTIGITFTLWYFQYKMLPVIHMFVMWDFSLIPVSIIVLLQIKPNKFLFIKTLFFATFSAYIAEPIFHLLKYFHPVNWRYTYSFILYIILYLICNFLSKRKNFEPL